MPRHLSICLLGAVVILLAGVAYSIPLLREKQAQKKAQIELQEKLRLELARRDEIENRIAAVKTDPRVVERLGREKFGLGRTGEVIFKFRGDLPPAPAAPLPTPSATAPTR